MYIHLGNLYISLSYLQKLHLMSPMYRICLLHNKISRQIAICKDDYKFATYSHSILQEFALKNIVIVTIHSERFPLQTEIQLHAQRIYLIRVLGMTTSITDELDFSWDPKVSSLFTGADLTLSATCAFSDLPSIAANLSWRSALLARRPSSLVLMMINSCSYVY